MICKFLVVSSLILFICLFVCLFVSSQTLLILIIQASLHLRARCAVTKWMGLVHCGPRSVRNGVYRIVNRWCALLRITPPVVMAAPTPGSSSSATNQQLLSTSWFDSAWIPALDQNNVLEYFSQRSNPFYDRTCNNEVIRMQRADPAQLL